jgi:hypothetical protein
MSRNATTAEIRTALRLADSLTGLCRRFGDADPAVPALVGVLAFAACDDEATVEVPL